MNTYTIKYQNIHQESKKYTVDSENVLDAIACFLLETQHGIDTICVIEC